MRNKIFGGIVAAGIVAGAGAAVAQDAEIYVGHGIPGAGGFPVDVSVDGICEASNFTFGSFALFVLPPDTYDIAVYGGGTGCTGAPAIGPAPIDINPGETATILAHLAEDGTPTATKFDDDLSPIQPGTMRLHVHHAAAAPPVHIDIVREDGAGAPLLSLSNVGNGAQARPEGRPGDWSVTISAGNAPVPPTPLLVNLKPKQAHFIYAVGDAGSNGADAFTVISRSEPIEKAAKN